MSKKDNPDVAQKGHLFKGPLLLPPTPERSRRGAKTRLAGKAMESIKVELNWGKPGGKK